MSKRRKSKPRRSKSGFDDALSAYRDQRFDEAESILSRLLQDDIPESRVAHLRGLTAMRREDGRLAETMLRLAVELDPASAGALSDLGNLLDGQAKSAEAVRCYRDALAIAPDHAQAGRNLGLTLIDLGRTQEALESFNDALSRNPDDEPLLLSKAKLLVSLDQPNEAIDALRQAIDANDSSTEPYKRLVSLYRRIGQHEQAAAVIDSWLAIEPDDPVAIHLKAASQQQPLTRASDEYVRRMFDEFAARFDDDLDALEYQGPELIRELMQETLGEPAGNLAVLDAGCGTGKCAFVLEPYAATLTGVDLSAKMIEKAAALDIYHSLVVAELSDYIASHREQFNVIVAADTFHYFGDLQPVLLGARAAVKHPGYLLFTLERSAADQSSDYRLNPNGRFSHREDYFEQQLSSAGWSLTTKRVARLRNEAGVPVEAWLVAACTGLSA